MKYIHQYSENRKIQVQKIKTTEEKLIEENELLVKNKEDKLLVIESSKTEKDAFLSDKKQQQVVLDKIKNNQSSLSAKLKKQENEKRKIAQAIRNAIKKEMAKNKPKTKSNPDKTKTFTTTPEVKLAGKKFEQNKGKLPWPVSGGAVTSNYGRQQHSVVNTTYIENNGIDISTDKAAKVRVVFTGTVTSILTIPGAGKAVIVSHGNYRTVYANLKEVNVTTGQKLITKQNIGVLLPNSTGKISESHFEIWRITDSDMKTVNPASWLVRR
jgi:septal ring factor EnvC (AmiA/AmiB activator)